MQPVAQVGSIVAMLLLLIVVTPVITASVLSNVILSEHRSFKKTALYYLVSLPVLFTMSVLWIRLLPNGVEGYFLFSCFIILLQVYLLLSKRLRRIRT